MLVASSINAAPLPVNLPILRDVICGNPGKANGWETRGEADPDDAIGDAGEVGRCQIKPKTARQLGYRGKNKALFDADINLAWAWVKLTSCQTGVNPARPGRQYRRRRTVEDVIFCYRGGLLSGPKSAETFAEYAARIRADQYVIAVAALYRERMKLTAQR